MLARRATIRINTVAYRHTDLVSLGDVTDNLSCGGIQRRESLAADRIAPLIVDKQLQLISIIVLGYTCRLHVGFGRIS